MNWLDVLLLIVWAFYVWHSWGKGVYEVLAELVAWVWGWVVMLSFRDSFSRIMVLHLGMELELAEFVVGLVLMLVVVSMVYAGARLVFNRMGRQHFGWFWQMVGAFLPSIAVGGLMMGFVLLLISTMPGLSDAGLALTESRMLKPLSSVLKLR